jgi:polysaccharide deacetylase family protein (PEP-CTERM system associated)
LNNAFTVDMEDWYQGLTSTSKRIGDWPHYEDRVEENTHLLLSLLQKADTKATFFVLGYVADQFPELIQEIAASGHEIGLHGYYHRQVHKLTSEQFRQDLRRGKTALFKACGVIPLGYRAPMFSINHKNLWAYEILEDEGFIYDSSVYPTLNAWYGHPTASRKPYRPMKNLTLVEIPLSTVKLLGIKLPISGGFYLRVLPYSVLKNAIRSINREGFAANIYLHPWDLDPEQPIPNPTLRERFTHYYNLKTTENKVRQLLKEFDFSPLIDLLNSPTFVEEGGGNARP